METNEPDGKRRPFDAVSFRKDALIVVLIIILCTLLVMQLVPNEPFGADADAFSPHLPEPGGETAADQPQPDIRLTVDVHMADEAYRKLADRLRRAERAFPHIRADIANFPSDGAKRRLLAAAGAGELADVVLLDFDWVGAFAARGHLARWPGGAGTAADDLLARRTGWNGYRWLAAYETDPYVVAFSGSLETAAPDASVPRTLEEWSALREARGAEPPGGLIYADPEDPRAFVSLVSAMGGRWGRTEDGMFLPGENGLFVLELLYGRATDEEGEPVLQPLAVTEKLAEEDLWRRFSEGTLPFVVVPLSELAARGLAHKRVDGLTEESGYGMFWIKGTGFAVSSAAANAAEAFDWLETALAGHDPGPGGDWPPDLAEAFAGDPELEDKLAVLKEALPALHAGEADAVQFLDMLDAKRPAP